MNKFALISSIIILNAFYGYSQKNEIISKFQNNKSLSNANISICVQNMEGKEIVSFNKNKSLTPASVLKLVTTATAMEALGKDYVYKTELILDKTDKSRLIIRGYGDPTLGSEYLFQDQKGFLEEWVARIKKQNFQTPLNICIADDYFGYQGTSTKWVREDLGNYYASGAYGVSIFDNTYRLFFNTMNTAEPPKILRTEPPVKNIKFLNTMQLIHLVRITALFGENHFRIKDF